jgi:hypothetical protein
MGFIAHRSWREEEERVSAGMTALARFKEENVSAGMTAFARFKKGPK